MRTPDSSTPFRALPAEAALDDTVADVLEAEPGARAGLLDELERRDASRARAVRARIAALGELGLGLETAVREPGVPRSFGPYRLIERVAAGGMGEVHLARHEATGELAALKLVRPEYLPFENARARFQREIESVATLDHPGIARVLGMGEEHGVPWLALEWVGGASLQDVLDELSGVPPGSLGPNDFEAAVRSAARRRPHPEPERAGAFEGHDHAEVCARVVARVAEALAHAHAAGVLHRDVKPANVLVSPAGRVLLADFGLALPRDADRMTKSGAWLGSLPYAAPEQVDGGAKDLDARADVYSLGATLYELLTLRTPFLGGSESRVRRRITSGELEPPRRLNPRVSAPIGAVCLAAIDIDPRRRPPSARALADDLWRALRGERPRVGPAPSWLRARRWMRRRPVVATMIAAAALVVLGSVVVATREARLARRLSRLADAELVRGLLDESRAFWPAEPAELEAMSAWLARAEDALARVPEHAQWLEELGQNALPYAPEDEARDLAAGRADLAALALEIASLRRYTRGGGHPKPPPPAGPELVQAQEEQITELLARPPDQALAAVRVSLAEVGAELALDAERWRFDLRQLQDFDRALGALEREYGRRTTWRFDTALDAWRHAALRRLLEDFDRLATAVREVERQRADTQHMARFQEVEGARAWKAATAAIAASPRYGGLRLRPAFDLVPLGENAQSGLWEFLLAASGDAPDRDPAHPGRWIVRAETGIVLILIPGGRFSMGQREDELPPLSEWARPVHEIELAPFYVARYELTFGQAERLGDLGYDRVVPERRDMPQPLDWSTARNLIARVGLELPSEAQWERAARGGTSGPFPLEGAANVLDEARARALVSQGQSAHAERATFDDGWFDLAPVGWYRPNGFGLHDTLGNVAEWCFDSYVRRAYTSIIPRPVDGLRATIVPARSRVVRGGNCIDAIRLCQPGARAWDAPGKIAAVTGVRPVRLAAID